MSEMVERVGQALREACLEEFGTCWDNDVAWRFAEAAIAAGADGMSGAARASDTAVEIALAKGLLQVAYLAMPDTYFASDSRCELARETLRKHGIDPATIKPGPGC
jgi:hypothetical protein